MTLYKYTVLYYSIDTNTITHTLYGIVCLYNYKNNSGNFLKALKKTTLKGYINSNSPEKNPERISNEQSEADK